MVQQFKVCIRSRAPECRTVLQNWQDKTPKASPKKLYISWNTRKDFLKIPSLWEIALESEWRCFAKVILESNVTINITRSSDSFSTVPPIVNGGDWGCIVRDLETIIVLVFLAFNFIPERSHHSLTLPRSRIRNSDTAEIRRRPFSSKTYVQHFNVCDVINNKIMPQYWFQHLEWIHL